MLLMWLTLPSDVLVLVFGRVLMLLMRLTLPSGDL
jgi:hypothetical protein